MKGKWALAAIMLAVWMLARTAPAAHAEVSPGCLDYRQSIISMEQKSLRPAGWLEFDATLRSLYQANCIADPGRPQPLMFWYRQDGTRADGPPGNGPGEDPLARFATTEEHAAACRNAASPSVCALALDAAAEPAESYDPARKLPPLTLVIGGKRFNASRACIPGLETIAGFDGADNLRNRMKSNDAVDQLRASCPDLLQALINLTGVSPTAEGQNNGVQDLAFVKAASRVAAKSGGFAPGGRADPAFSIKTEPGFVRMCQDADSNMNTCRVRQQNMRSVGTQTMGREGQTGAFDQCAALYGAVLDMCRPAAAPVTAASAPSASDTGLRDRLRKSLSSAGSNATGASRPPPQASAPAMSDQCQALVQTYIAAAHVNNGPRALAGYNALKQAGGCGVLPQVDANAAPAGPDPRFQSRGATPMLDQTVLPCDQNPARCAQAVDALKAGTSPEAVAAMYTNAIGYGLQLGNMMAQGALAMQPRVNMPVPSYAQPNMNSLAAAPVRGTYGQGAPGNPAPPSSQSTITGLGR